MGDPHLVSVPRRSAGARLFVAIAAPDFLLSSLAEFVHVFVLLNVVTSLLEPFDIDRLGDGVDAVTFGFGEADAVIEDLNLVFADQVQHRFPVLTCDRNTIAWHEKILPGKGTEGPARDALKLVHGHDLVTNPATRVNPANAPGKSGSQ